MIGIVGYGMVGQAVANAFHLDQFVVDPKHFPENTLADLIENEPEVIFVCVPTDDGDDFKTLLTTIDQIQAMNYQGIVVVKSTVLPHILEGYDVVYNPEFLSRATANEDFQRPEYLILGGNEDKCNYLLGLYDVYSTVRPHRIFITSIETAALVKYMMNSFFATKVTFMNQMYDVAKEMGADFDRASDIVSHHPWFGSNHNTVPGHEGRGFAGPCLPKDTKALYNYYKPELLGKVLELNDQYRK